jgi:hypothetical protein
MEVSTVMKVWDLRLVTSHHLRHPMFNEIFFYHSKMEMLVSVLLEWVRPSTN